MWEDDNNPIDKINKYANKWGQNICTLLEPLKNTEVLISSSSKDKKTLLLDAPRWFVTLSSWWKKERLIDLLFIYCAKIINCLNSIFPRHNVTGVDHATSK